MKPMAARVKGICVLVWLLAQTGAPVHAQSVLLGLDAGFHLQHSANTLRFSPGLGALAILHAEPFQFEARLYLGGLFGYSIWFALDALYVLPAGDWRPLIGLSLNLDWGNYFFHTQSAFGYIRPALPEAGIGLVIKPLVFTVDRCQISILRLLVGTDFQYFGQVLLVEWELISLAGAL